MVCIVIRPGSVCVYADQLLNCVQDLRSLVTIVFYSEILIGVYLPKQPIKFRRNFDRLRLFPLLYNGRILAASN